MAIMVSVLVIGRIAIMVHFRHWKFPFVPGYYPVAPTVIAAMRHVLLNRTGPVGCCLVLVSQVPAILQAAVTVVNGKLPLAVQQDKGVGAEYRSWQGINKLFFYLAFFGAFGQPIIRMQ